MTKEFIASRRPSLLEIIFNGRRIRRIRIALNVERSNDELLLSDRKSNEDITTIKKSKKEKSNLF